MTPYLDIGLILTQNKENENQSWPPIMIRSLQGKVESFGKKDLTLNVGGVGYSVFCNPEKYSLGQDLKLLIHYHWNSENGPTLFGFSSELEIEVFKTILDCPKVGPSSAMSILSQVDAKNFIMLIMTEDEAALSKFNGVGGKTAKNLILFLKEKFEKNKLYELTSSVEQGSKKTVLINDLKMALLALEYSPLAVSKVCAEFYTDQEDHSFDQMLKVSLKKLNSLQR